MKLFKVLVFGVVLILIFVVVYMFFYWSGVKKQLDWYKDPVPMPTHLADSIVKRSTEKFVNAYNGSKVDPHDQGAAIFSFAADNRTLESYLALNNAEDMEANGIERPQCEKVGDNVVRISTRITKGILKGAIIYTNVSISVTKEGKLRLEPGPLMAGTKQVPSMVLSKIEKEAGFIWGPMEISPSELRFDDADKQGLVIQAKLLKVEIADREMVFTLRKLK